MRGRSHDNDDQFMKEPKPKVTHQKGYEIGIEGQLDGKCCGSWCLDCDFIRRKVPELKKQYDEKYGEDRK